MPSETADVLAARYGPRLRIYATGTAMLGMVSAVLTTALLAQAGVSADVQISGALHFLGRVVQAQAYTAGFRDSFLVCALIFTAALVPAWIMGMRRATAA